MSRLKQQFVLRSSLSSSLETMNHPEIYESSMRAPRRLNEEFLPKLINVMTWRSNQGEKVLDYGCGPGSSGYKHILPLVLHQPDSLMYSVDCSSRMVEFASKNYEHEKITYKVGSILYKFPFRHVRFTKIFAINVFHFVQDIKKALEGFYDILELGGQLAFTSTTISSVFCQSWRILGESKSWKEYMNGYQNFMPKWTAYDGDGEAHFRKLFERAGLHVKFMEVTKREFVFENINDGIDFCVSTTPCFDAIPEELHACFKTDIRKILTTFAGIPFHSPSVVLPFEYMAAVVEKK